ncbi:hypothetical protein HOP50_01g06540 [Chloropicon primus]|uniref:Uncharacterized protein n=1 Tax=Chloropicon primus TaxID=1764295 RepID=A0A5B8MD56_9CHLO|nr:hypothetical protein A3770_01p06690 [Chloropicon primus]UPQ97363.1 hypothetical protein HOP50_01g06540 [Chloropicon primus]|eukprot:QDZ18151.1 hypothetical protein A3770_01p06690 [Chloropicon primus]
MAAVASSREEEEPLLSIEQKVEAFLSYLELENDDMLRYHMQACGKLMDEAPLVRHVTREGGHMHDGHIHVGNPSEDERNLYLRPTVDRAGNLYRKRKLAKKTIKIGLESTPKYLKRAYVQYSTGRHKRGRGEPFMEKCGFLNLLRDCQLLDNKTTLLDLADFVDKELGGRSGQGQGQNGASNAGSSQGQQTSSSNHYNSRPLSIEDIDHLLRKTACLKYPEEGEEEAIAKLYEINIVPFIKQSNGADETLVQLFDDKVLNVVKKHAKALKVVYSHYATLSLVSFHHSNWKAVRRANRALTLDEYVTFMLNFEVAPTLFNHHDIEEVFDKSNQNQQFGEDRLVWMNFSQFIESILRCGIRVVNSLESQISSKSTTITELNSFKKFVSRLPTNESKLHFTNVLALRRKAAHDKIVMTQQTSKMSVEESTMSDMGLGSSPRRGAGTGSPSTTAKNLTAGGSQLTVNSEAMNTVWAEVDEEEYRLEMVMRKKQEALNVTMKSLKEFIQDDLGQVADARDGGSEFIEADLELEEFEERLGRNTWKAPKDEMKGWKTGVWKLGATTKT